MNIRTLPILILCISSTLLSFNKIGEGKEGVNKPLEPYRLFTTGGPDTFGYTYLDSDEVGGTVAFEDISTTGTLIAMTDDGETNISMPFEFELYNTISRNLRVGENGAIRFGQTAGNISSNNGTIPGNPSNLIAPWWDDLVYDNSGARVGVYSQVLGATPNRRFIVQWNNVGHENRPDGRNITFQVVLYEGTNNIDFVYSDTDLGSGTYDHGASATIGINRNTTDALLYSRNTASLAGVTSIRIIHPDNAIAMNYLSSGTTQNTNAVYQGRVGNPILGIQISVDGNSSPLSVTNFNFNTIGSNNPTNDIRNAKVYYTGNSPIFGTEIQVGTVVANPNGSFTISGTQALVNGTNYFWLTYDIPTGAIVGNVVDARLPSLTVGSARVPAPTSPAGNRTIVATTGASCAAALSIAPSCGTTVVVNGTTVGGDVSGTVTDCGGASANDTEEIRWYTFVGTGGSVTAETINIGSVLNDTQLWVYRGTCGGLVCVGGNDDVGASLYSRVTFATTKGTTYYIAVGEYDSPTPAGPFRLNVTFDGAMSYTSSTTTQNTTRTLQSATDQQVIGVEVVGAGGCDALDVTSLSFNTTGSTNATNDIANAKVYYTGTSSTFVTTTQIGTTQANPNGAFTVAGFTQALSAGTNYFWLAYDIKAGAADGNVVDAQCTSITVDSTPRIPTVTAPTGARTINPNTRILRGNLLDFDGGDWLRATGYKGILGNTNRTVEMWVRSNQNNNRTLIDWGDQDDDGQRWQIQRMGNGRVRINIEDQRITTTGGFIDIDDGSWHHVAVVLNGNNSAQISVFVDGVLQNVARSDGRSLAINTGADGSRRDVHIGANYNRGNRYRGEIDEVRIWNDARTEDEIRRNMHITLAGNEPNLVNYWQFNEVSGTTFADATANNITLTRGNGATVGTFPTIEPSTVAVAGGVSDLQVVNSTGNVAFAGTDVTMNFTAAPGVAADFVVYKLTGEDAPGNNPVTDIPTLNRVTPIYWVIRAFGAGAYTTNVAFALGSGAVSTADAATPTNLKLVSRASNSFGAWSNVGSANTAVEATGTITFNGISSFSQIKIGTINNSPLPITLKSFTGIAKKGMSILKWVTSTEINNDRFELLRSGDGLNYEVVATINGAGTTTEEQQYQYVDKVPLYGRNYYRLRQIDIDGTSSTEEKIVVIEHVNNPLEGKLSYVLYPNPTDQSNININISSADTDRKLQVSIYDMYGRSYHDQEYTADILNRSISINTTQQMESGMYLVIVQQGDQKVQHKLIIQ